MFRHATRETLHALTRLVSVTVFLCLAIEVALVAAQWQGTSDGSGRSVIGVGMAVLNGDAPPEFRGAGEPLKWRSLIANRAMESGRILLIAVVVVCSFGYTLGILAGRFRGTSVISVFLSPFYLLLGMPAVWGACLCVWWLVEYRGQPLYFETFPAIDSLNGIENWWKALFPAILLGLTVIGTQIQVIVGAIKNAARAYHVRAAFSQGHAGADLFYGSIVRSVLGKIVGSFGRVFLPMIGLQIFVEWAFRYPGLGTLMIESAHSGSFEGIFAGGGVLAVLVVLIWWGEEMVKGLMVRKRPELIKSCVDASDRFRWAGRVRWLAGGYGVCFLVLTGSLFVERGRVPGSFSAFWLGGGGAGDGMMAGMLAALAVNAWAALLSSVGGVVIGMRMVSGIAGYLAEERVAKLRFLTGTFLCLPALYLLLVWSAGVGTGFWKTVLLMTILIAMYMAHHGFRWLAELENCGDVLAARALGVGRRRMLREHFWPRLFPKMAAMVAGLLPVVMVAETALSFAGFGLGGEILNAGNLIKEGREAMFDAPRRLFLPGAALWCLAVLFGLLAREVRLIARESVSDRLF